MTNVLLITTDQQRADTLGCYGNPVIQTPNLDALAAAGTRFDAARTQNPFCQPARATILTSTYPSQHGVTFNGIDLPDDEADRGFAAAFEQAGWRTALIGKAHFATTYPLDPTGKLESVEGSARMADDWFGPYFGFGHVELILFGHMLRVAPLMGNWNWCFGPAPFGLHYARYLFRDGDTAGRERLRRMQPEAAGATWDRTQTWANALDEEDHPSTWVGDRTIAWLRERAAAGEPFVGWASFTDPHHPFDPPAPWSGMYDPADLAEVLPTGQDRWDTKPGHHHLWTNTAPRAELEFANPGGATYSRDELARMHAGYYALISQIDHQIGRILATLDELGLADDTLVLFTTDHGEFLGEHQMMFKGPLHYESLLRVPLLARGPGFEAGVVVDAPVGTIDLAPTMYEACGVEAPAHTQGRTLRDHAREWVLTEDDFDLGITIPQRTVTTDRYKLTRYLALPGVGELYDLHDDPGELVSRWDDPSYESTKTDLLALLDEICLPTRRTLPKVGVVA